SGGDPRPPPGTAPGSFGPWHYPIVRIHRLVARWIEPFFSPESATMPTPAAFYSLLLLNPVRAVAGRLGYLLVRLPPRSPARGGGNGGPSPPRPPSRHSQP